MRITRHSSDGDEYIAGGREFTDTEARVLVDRWHAIDRIWGICAMYEVVNGTEVVYTTGDYGKVDAVGGSCAESQQGDHAGAGDGKCIPDCSAPEPASRT